MKSRETKVEGRGPRKQSRDEYRESRTGQAQIHAGVTDFERKTSYCPLYVAVMVLDEASLYFRVRLPDSLADTLAERVARVFAHQPLWRKRIQGRNGHGWLKCFMRHWLASALAAERPAVFRALPDSFKIGQPLPARSLTRLRHPLSSDGRGATKRGNQRPRFVHGCELLAT